MYPLSDSQIDFILSDIRARGVEMEGLQDNLLDHVCCIIEQNLEENGDFEGFYQKTIATFYKDALWEIEEETLLLLTFKNYYAMKKIMILSGTIAATSFILGSILKLLHSPGANMFIVFAMLCSSLVFLPIFFLFKTKEVQETKNKVLVTIGTLNGLLFCFSSLFKLMHWPYANALWFMTIGVLILVFIPLYFFVGIKNSETKTNTIATTIILVIISGFFFSLTSLQPAKRFVYSKMYDYLQTQDLIGRMSANIPDSLKGKTELFKLSAEIMNSCDKLKGQLIYDEIMEREIPADFESKKMRIDESGLGDEFNPGKEGHTELMKLKTLVEQYNVLQGNITKEIPISNTLNNMTDSKIMLHSNYNLLSHISQIQLYVLQNELNMVRSK